MHAVAWWLWCTHNFGSGGAITIAMYSGNSRCTSHTHTIGVTCVNGKAVALVFSTNTLPGSSIGHVGRRRRENNRRLGVSASGTASNQDHHDLSFAPRLHPLQLSWACPVTYMYPPKQFHFMFNTMGRQQSASKSGYLALPGTNTPSKGVRWGLESSFENTDSLPSHLVGLIDLGG